ncbi:MAG: hypothetical protein LBN29_08065 [Mediterranea sp.]|nr:hypothetical protein [Mediterranea sp.]
MNNDKLKKSKVLGVGKFLLTSAPFALLLSIAFFWFEMYKNDKESDQMISELRQIEQSLSTRNIGIFPDYLEEINTLFDGALNTTGNKADADTIVIFEDVLFYGAFYNGKAFKEMVLKLTELSSKGVKIVIAFYENRGRSPAKTRMFREVVQESWMQQSDLMLMAQERTQELERLREEGRRQRGVNNYQLVDSTLSEKYFARYRDNNRDEFEKRIKKILVPLYNDDRRVFQTIDQIKRDALGKPTKELRFHDFYTAYHQITETLRLYYEQINVDLIPLTSYLTMSCWSTGKEVLFAFPGRFAADEIGFISHDEAILRYINTMLEGARMKGEE